MPNVSDLDGIKSKITFDEQSLLRQYAAITIYDNDRPTIWDTNGTAVGEVISSSYFADGRALLFHSLPIVASSVLNITSSFINLAFAGHLPQSKGSNVVFAAVSLANMWSNVTLLSVLIGMTSAVETLVSQNNGAENYRVVGIILQRSILVLCVMSIPLAMTWLCAKDLFLACGLDSNVANAMQSYLAIRSIAIPADILTVSLQKYLIAIGVMRPPMWANGAQNILIFGLNCVLVHRFNFDFRCLAWSWVLTAYVCAGVQYYACLSHPSVRRTLQPWDYGALRGWGEYFALGVPGTLMVCSEWWAYEVLTFFASQLGTVEVAAQSIILQTSSLAFMVPMSLGIVTASKVGNALGAGKPDLAIRLSKVALFLAIMLEAIFGCSIYFGGAWLVKAFDSNEQVQQIAIEMLPFLSVAVVADGIQAVASGILRGTGKQVVGATLNIVAFYAVGLPLAFALCFHTTLGVKGLIIGISCGSGFQAVCLLAIIFGREAYVYNSVVSTSSNNSFPNVNELMREPDLAAIR